MSINGRKIRGCLGVMLLAGLFTGLAAPASAAPRTLCLNDGAGSFSLQASPRHCNFYDAGAPGRRTIKSAIFRTSAMAWGHWGHKTALGHGRSRQGGKWLRVDVRLDRPRAACGQRVFTRIRFDLKTCGGGWTGWSTPTAIERCA
jgi:hypothetical protein